MSDFPASFILCLADEPIDPEEEIFTGRIKENKRYWYVSLASSGEMDLSRWRMVEKAGYQWGIVLAGVQIFHASQLVDKRLKGKPLVYPPGIIFSRA